MPLTEAHLNAWSGPGAQRAATATYTSIKAALDSAAWPQGVPQIYLQGSYRNDTHIRAESDVDVVVESPTAFRADVSALTAAERAALAATYGNAQYTWDQAHRDTVAALQRYYGRGSVTVGSKAIAVATPYLTADVVVAIQHRRYERFIQGTDDEYVSGIAIWSGEDRDWLINYPKLHYENGVAKQRRTHDRYKPMVRAIKNAALRCVELGALAAAPPSYASECFVYSAPDGYFSPNQLDTYRGIVDWATAGNWPVIRRVSEQGFYVGAGPGQWPFQDAQRYVMALGELWQRA